MFIRIQDGKIIKYPYTYDDLREEYTSVSFPLVIVGDMLAPFGVFSVNPVSPPRYNPLLVTVKEDTPKIDEETGQWKQIWVPHIPTEEEVNVAMKNIIANIEKEIQLRLDTFAQTKGYENIAGCISYLISTIEKYKNEAQYCAQLRDNTWKTFYDHLETEEFPVNGYKDIESILPVPLWTI